MAVILFLVIVKVWRHSLVLDSQPRFGLKPSEYSNRAFSRKLLQIVKLLQIFLKYMQKFVMSFL